MAEQDFKFDDALLMKTAREMLAKKLTETVKEAAKSGEWEITTIEQEESDPEKILPADVCKIRLRQRPGVVRLCGICDVLCAVCGQGKGD